MNIASIRSLSWHLVLSCLGWLPADGSCEKGILKFTTVKNTWSVLQESPQVKTVEEVKWSEVQVAQSCLTLCNSMDYTVCGILQARILEWVAFPFFRGSSQPRDQTQVSHTAGGFFTSWATREAMEAGCKWWFLPESYQPAIKTPPPDR